MIDVKQMWRVAFWSLAILFVIGAIASFGFGILVYIWGKGMESFGQPSEVNITYILGCMVFFLPAIHFLSLIIISFSRKVYVKYITRVFFVTHVTLVVLYALSIIQLKGKDESINMSLIFVGCSAVFWLLFVAMFKVKKMCGHFEE